MKTREEATAAAQAAADRTGRSKFVYPLLGCFGYGSQSWVDGMDEKPRDLREVKPLAEVLTIAQIEADRVGQTMSVVRTSPHGEHSSSTANMRDFIGEDPPWRSYPSRSPRIEHRTRPRR